MQHHEIIRQQGFVSIFTVIFFMLLVSVITIGFLRIMTVEQRQATDNDLTASALAAAESGVEDAKRVILKYNSLPEGAQKSDLASVMNSSDCKSFLNNSVVQSLNISTDGRINKNRNDLDQYYTCLSVILNSPDYVSSTDAGKSEFIPLRPEAGKNFDQIIVSWHLLSNQAGTEGDGKPRGYAASLSLPTVGSWTSAGYPAYMRAQLYGFPNGSFNRSALDDRSRTVFLIPGTFGTTGSINIGAADPLPHTFDQTKSQPQAVRCNPNFATSLGSYACSVTLDLPNDPGLRGSNNNYYLRVTPLYGSSHFKLQLKDSATNTIVNFDGVQPLIDSTGRANDVFRRIQARVRVDGTADLPEFSLESADTICKNMLIADPASYRASNCN